MSIDAMINEPITQEEKDFLFQSLLRTCIHKF